MVPEHVRLRKANKPPILMNQVHSTLHIVASISLIIFSSTLNQWKQFTQIVIYQDTVQLVLAALPAWALLIYESMPDQDVKAATKIP